MNTPQVLKKLDQEFWILVGLKDLYQMCKDVNQLEVVKHEKELFVLVKRVVKSKVMVPNYVLRKYNIPYVMFMGLFLVVEGYSIHKDIMENFLNNLMNDYGRIVTSDELEKYRIPSDSMLTTVTLLDNGYGFMLKNTLVNKLFKSCNDFEYLMF